MRFSLVLFVLTGGLTSAVAEITIKDLGRVAGRDSVAYAINNKGQVAGDAFGAFLWTEANGIAALKTLGGTWSQAVRMNELGHVVGSSTLRSLNVHATRWTAQGIATDLGTLGGAGSSAKAVNALGHVVGISETKTGASRAFLWWAGKKMVDLGTLGGVWSDAEDINDNGQVVGRSQTHAGISHAFIWQAGKGMTDIGAALGGSSWAKVINEAGQVAGGFGSGASERGFLWDPKLGVIDLGTLGGGRTRVSAINNKGQVVGFSETGSGSLHAFIWSAQTGMIDLGTLGGRASAATAINEMGHVVGYVETNSGSTNAYIWKMGQGMTGLNTLGGNRSQAYAINDKGLIVGSSKDSAGRSHAVMWIVKYDAEYDEPLTYNVRWWNPSLKPQSLRKNPTPLLRQLGIISATALVISNMIGTGIFTTSGFLASDLGNAYLILGIWVVGAICALAGAFSYSELGVNFPSSGGEYVYLTRAYGPTWGFMTGWVSFFAGFSAPIALAALAFAEYVGYFFPAAQARPRCLHESAQAHMPSNSGEPNCRRCPDRLFTLLNFFGVRRVARLQNVLTAARSSLCWRSSSWDLRSAAATGSTFNQPAARGLDSLPSCAVCDQPLFHLLELQRVERRDLCSRRAQAAISHLAYRSCGGNGPGCDSVYRAERRLYLWSAPRHHEGRGSYRIPGCLPLVRARSGGDIQCAHGFVAGFNCERDGYHWPASLLCDGEERRVFRRGSPGRPPVAHAGDGDSLPRRLRHPYDRHSVSGSAPVYRVYPEFFRRDVCRVAVHFPEAAWLAETGSGQLRLAVSARAISDCWHLDDHIRDYSEACDFSCRGADSGDGSSRLSLPHPARTRLESVGDDSDTQRSLGPRRTS